MSAISNQDAQRARAMMRAVDLIYSAAMEPSRWPDALQSIADVTSDFGAILIYGKDDGSFGTFGSPSMEPVIAEYQRAWSYRDIRAIRTREKKYFSLRDVITDRDVLTADEIATDPFYADYLKRYGLKYFAAAMVSPDPHIEVAISVQRRDDREEYSENELEAVRVLGLHVERSLRLGMRLMDAELEKLGLNVALNRIGIGVFVLDSMGRVLLSNTAAQSLLGDGISVVENRVRIAKATEQAETEVAVRRLLSGEADGIEFTAKPILLSREKSKSPLALYIMPIPHSENPARQFLTHARVIMLVVDSSVREPLDPSIIRDVFKLTLGEARIASLVGHGLAPRQAAEKLGIAEETARSVLKRVFQKVGVSKQSELAALIGRLMLR